MAPGVGLGEIFFGSSPKEGMLIQWERHVLLMWITAVLRITNPLICLLISVCLIIATRTDLVSLSFITFTTELGRRYYMLEGVTGHTRLMKTPPRRLLDLQTHCSNLQVDKKRHIFDCSVCFSPLSFTRRHEPKHQLGGMPQSLT